MVLQYIVMYTTLFYYSYYSFHPSASPSETPTLLMYNYLYIILQMLPDVGMVIRWLILRYDLLCLQGHSGKPIYIARWTQCHNVSLYIVKLIMFLGAAAGSPYIVFKLTFSYGFMLRIYIYIYIYIYNTPTYGCASMLTFILNVLGEVLGIVNLYCRPFYSAGSGPCARPRDFENRLRNDVLANFGRSRPPLILEQTPTALLVDEQRDSF